MVYPLATNTWGEEELDAIRRCLDSGQVTMAREVEDFEARFAAFHGRRYAVMVNSGSSANLVATAALCFRKDRPLQRGDEVIVPAISWATTYTPFQQYGQKLRFVDVDLHTLNMDVNQLADALTADTRAISVVSILGNPAELDAVRAFADAHGLYLLEDNCESLGARSADGRLAGTFGDLSTFSFFFSHHICTIEGGMILTDDAELFHLCRSLRAHGWTRDLPSDSPVFERQADEFYEAYRFVLPGYNVRPTDLAGAVGSAQLKKLPEMLRRRRRNLATFQSMFGNDPGLVIQRENGESSSFCFPMVVASGDSEDRRRLFEAFAAADIAYRIVTGGCFPRHEVIKYFDYSCVDDLPNANFVHDYGFFLGNSPEDLEPQLARAREIVSAVLESGK